MSEVSRVKRLVPDLVSAVTRREAQCEAPASLVVEPGDQNVRYLSESARILADSLKARPAQEGYDAARVMRVAMALADGRYRVSPARIAEAFLNPIWPESTARRR